MRATALDTDRRRGASRAFAALALAVLLCASLPAAARVSGERSLDRIEGMIRAGQFAPAEEALAALDPADRSAKADYLHGFTLLRLYRFGEAESALRRAVDAS